MFHTTKHAAREESTSWDGGAGGALGRLAGLSGGGRRAGRPRGIGPEGQAGRRPGGDALGVRADGPQPDQHGHRLARTGVAHRGAELPAAPRQEQGWRTLPDRRGRPGSRSSEDTDGDSKAYDQDDRLRRQDIPPSRWAWPSRSVTTRRASIRAAASMSATAPTCSCSRIPTAMTRPTSATRF